MSNKVKVWDVPTRLFHWTLLAMFVGMWASAENGQLQIHTKLGVAMLVLVVFRLLWGVVGSQTARFSDFFKPCQVKAYLRGEVTENQQPGHNPLGGLMVVALLGALLVQLGLGLFAADVDSYTFDGPLAKLIDSGLAEQVTEWHEIWFNVLLGLVGVHVLAIVAYRKLKNTNLVPPMITGSKTLAGEVKPLRFAPGWLGLVVLAVAAVLVVGGLSLV
ncbi:MAG: cytochrome b/b6 domain-containing protein [Vogesella sp.]|nr:cytochrome b/b6 domain-containing protein [Vogesella sp.]